MFYMYKCRCMKNNLAIAHDDGDMCCLVCRLLSIADVKVSKHIKILGFVRFNTFKSLDQYRMDTCKTLLNLRNNKALFTQRQQGVHFLNDRK